MAWEENSCISLNMQLIAILSRIGVIKCTFAIDMVTEAKGITIISKL